MIRPLNTFYTCNSGPSCLFSPILSLAKDIRFANSNLISSQLHITESKCHFYKVIIDERGYASSKTERKANTCEITEKPYRTEIIQVVAVLFIHDQHSYNN
jgi:hypothetical protein